MSSPAPSRRPSRLRVGAFALLGLGVIAALIGVFTLIGGGGGGSQTAAPAPSPTAAPGPTDTVTPAPGTGTAPGASPTPDAGVPVPSFGATPTNGLAAPGAGDSGDGSGGTGSGAAGSDGSGSGGSGSGSGGSGSGASGSGSGGSGSSGSGSGSGSGGAGSGGAGASASAVRAPLRVYNNSTITGLAARAATDFRAAGWTVEEVANYPFGIIPTTTVYYQPGTSEKAPADQLGEETGIRVNPRFEGLKDATPGLIVIVTNDYGKA